MYRQSSSRIPDVLETLKTEFENISHDANVFKAQRDEYERKLQAQLTEMQILQTSLSELERAYVQIKKQYEEDLKELHRNRKTSGGSYHTGVGSKRDADSAFYSPHPSTNVSKVPPMYDITAPSTSSPPSASPNNSSRDGQDNSHDGHDVGKVEDAPMIPEAPEINPEPVNYPPSNGDALRLGGNRESIGSRFPSAFNSNTFASGSSMYSASSMLNAAEHAAPLQDLAAEADAIRRQGGTNNNSAPATNLPQPPHEPGQASPKQEAAKEDKSLEADWIVGYNPSVQTKLNVDLAFNLDHQSVVCCVRFSRDGQMLATGCNRSARIYNVATGNLIHSLPEQGKNDCYIRSVCFSPDGSKLAVGAEDKRITLWDTKSKSVIKNFLGHELDIYSLDYSKNGKFIVSGSGDNTAKLWDVDTGKCVFSFGNTDLEPTDGITSVCFSPDGSLVSAGSLDKVVRVWDTHTGHLLERFEGHTESVYSVTFSPDGKSLASGSLDKTLKLWDLANRSRSRCRSTFSGHRDYVLSVAFSPDGNWLVSGSKDRSVQFWDPRSAVTHMMLQGHKNSVISVSLNPAGNTFATASGDFRARIWKYG